MPPLQNCCCCELKTGVLIIAILGWIFTLIKVFGLVSIAGQNHNPSPHISYDGEELKFTTNSGPTSVLPFQIIYSLISLTCCILLIVGVAKNGRYYFLPWMILNFMEYLLVSLGVVIGFFILFSSLGALGFLVALFLLFISICVLCWYLWVVVYSYYVFLKEAENAVGANLTTNPPPYSKEGHSEA